MSGSNDDTTEATKQEAMRQARLLGLDEERMENPELTKVAATLKAMFPQTTDVSRPLSGVANWLIQDGLPEWLIRFLTKNADYGDQHAIFGLGSKAEFIGIWRKVWKLKRALHDGQPMNGEDVDEMLDDLIATCFLIKHLRAIEHGEVAAPRA